MEIKTLPSVSSLLEGTPSEVLAWTESTWNQGNGAAHNWWVGLAEGASLRAFADEAVPDREWANVAITIYEHLDTTSPQGCASCIASAMLLRVRLIRQFGHNPDDPLLDAQRITRWFYDQLEMPREDALRMSQTELASLWASDAEDLHKLRKIKNRLSVIRHLAEVYQVDNDLQQWLDIQTQLP